MRHRAPALLTILLFAATTAVAAPPAPAPAAAWAPLAFLVGDWVGVAAPGEPQGEFSLREECDGRVLVRRNATVTPQGRHEDLMVVYHEAPGPDRALYCDNEGHVIHYTLAPAPGPGQAVLVSDAAAGAPRFRLTYRLDADGLLAIDFAIQPPGAPDFRTYLAGRAKRR
jgi:hypothetical protein